MLIKFRTTLVCHLKCVRKSDKRHTFVSLRAYNKYNLHLQIY